MPYQPGTHVIASLTGSNHNQLMSYCSFQEIVNELIEEHELKKLGEVYHDFEPSGFTGVICLSESHISIHTWPEYRLINIDIYLSNYERNNDGTVAAIYQRLQQFFDAAITNEQIIRR